MLTSAQHRVHRLAWVTLWYNIGVILWGALVRATGAGAGCGSHWPDCNGEVIPSTENAHTWIEFTHRITTGIDGFLMLALLVLIFKHWPKGHLARKGAVWSMVFLLIEAAIGAALVKFELTADNPKPERAWVVAGHLVNTLLLVGAMCLTCWWSKDGTRLELRERRNLTSWLLGCMGVVILLTATGAVTALGDTLFPSESLAEGFAQDRSATAHIFVKLRIWHPVLALVAAVFCISLASDCRQKVSHPDVNRWASRLQTVVIIQILFGALNLILLAPIWAQMIHLLLANLLWISLVFLAATTLGRPMPLAADG